MAELAAETRDMNFQLEQVQDFTPTPMTVSTVTWYSGYHPYTLQEEFAAHSPEEKLRQRMFFFWYKPEERQSIIRELKRIGRQDLIDRLYPRNFVTAPPKGKDKGKSKSKEGNKKPKKASSPSRRSFR